MLDNNREQFIRALQAIEPHQRLVLTEKLLAYAIPKIQSVANDDGKKSSSLCSAVVCGTTRQTIDEETDNETTM